MFYYTYPRADDDCVSRARSSARACRRFCTIVDTVGCSPPSTRRAVRTVSSSAATASRRSSSAAAGSAYSVTGHHGGRAGGILSIRGPEVSLGRLGSVLDVGKRRRRVRWGFRRWIHIGKVHGGARPTGPSLQSFGSRALWRAPSTGACGAGDYPTPELSRSESEGRSASEKSK